MLLRKDFFISEDTHAVPLGVACHKLLGADWVEYETRTIYEELERLGYSKLAEVNAAKINAYRVAKRTILPWVDHEAFEKTVMGLNGDLPNFSLREPLNIGKCMVGVDALRAIQQVPFTDNVKRYIASCGKFAELDFLPEPLSFVMPQLCTPMYECLDCGSVDEDDLEDGQCDECVGRYEDGTVNGRPEEGLEDRGRNIRRFMPYEYAGIASDFRRLSRVSIDNIDLKDSHYELQLGMLLAYNQYREDAKFKMNQQLREVVHVRRL
jgi:hypothetical protein